MSNIQSSGTKSTQLPSRYKKINQKKENLSPFFVIDTNKSNRSLKPVSFCVNLFIIRRKCSCQHSSFTKKDTYWHHL